MATESVDSSVHRVCKRGLSTVNVIQTFPNHDHLLRWRGSASAGVYRVALNQRVRRIQRVISQLGGTDAQSTPGRVGSKGTCTGIRIQLARTNQSVREYLLRMLAP